ncbi:sensor histidine kinase [Filimonas effusa]|uniref:histidine kinase n=1 Tax=Filimonas effusa TaxID=2508721 RepID=A0A4Q1D803_9BACT|nr:HAMP domain-containing sensor histidine kinase [Filimonas effusa]RXK83847.1 HAMP domain-containing histidine kinase [Filimonas effusa]
MINRLYLSRLLMSATLLLIAGFLCYWLTQQYKTEYNTLQRKTDLLLREAVQQVQAERMKGLHLSFNDSAAPGKRRIAFAISTGKEAGLDSLLKQRTSAGGNFRMHFHERDDLPPPPVINMAIAHMIDSLSENSKSHGGRDSQDVKKLLEALKKVDDSIPLRKLEPRYLHLLQQDHIGLGFILKRTTLHNRRAAMDSVPQITGAGLVTRFAMSGFNAPWAYYAVFDNPFPYIAKQLLQPFLFSLLLLGITTVSFIFLYRNMLVQRRLADMKNEFISNITHELKTPVATVNVAIEALRNFNVLEDTERTREYLDISAVELQRLNLLIDKVLRLSMFENRAVALQPAPVDMATLVHDVLTGMKLQLEKANASVQVKCSDDLPAVYADKMHLTSVVYNLLDNAIKYSPGHPVINISLFKQQDSVYLEVADNGIGIAPVYTQKIFEKFFRIPYNDRHQTRGYGLGLSYVAHIISLHKGSVTVTSEEGKGSTFTVKLPLDHE